MYFIQIFNVHSVSVQVNVRRQQRALTEDTEGPRMSMAMRRQLGMAPNRSPSKAGAPIARCWQMH